MVGGLKRILAGGRLRTRLHPEICALGPICAPMWPAPAPLWGLGQCASGEGSPFLLSDLSPVFQLFRSHVACPERLSGVAEQAYRSLERLLASDGVGTVGAAKFHIQVASIGAAHRGTIVGLSLVADERVSTTSRKIGKDIGRLEKGRHSKREA